MDAIQRQCNFENSLNFEITLLEMVFFDRGFAERFPYRLVRNGTARQTKSDQKPHPEGVLTGRY